MADKATYEKSAAELDLETRLENGNQSHRILTTAEAYVAPTEEEAQGRDFRVEGNKVDGYVGVDPIYQTYANKTDAPVTNKSKSVIDKVTEEFVANLNPVVEAPTEGGSGGPATPAANPTPVVPS